MNLSEHRFQQDASRFFLLLTEIHRSHPDQKVFDFYTGPEWKRMELHLNSFAESGESICSLIPGTPDPVLSSLSRTSPSINRRSRAQK
jgi:hypothetical protein